MNESTQIIELLNNENPTFTNISYKAVNRTKINNFKFEGKRKDTSLVITRSFQYFFEHRHQL